MSKLNRQVFVSEKTEYVVLCKECGTLQVMLKKCGICSNVVVPRSNRFPWEQGCIEVPTSFVLDTLCEGETDQKHDDIDIIIEDVVDYLDYQNPVKGTFAQHLIQAECERFARK